MVRTLRRPAEPRRGKELNKDRIFLLRDLVRVGRVLECYGQRV